MKDPPKIINELISVDWLDHLFSHFELNHKNVPNYQLDKGLYTHAYKLMPQEFGEIAAEHVTINLSDHFSNFSISMNTRSIDVFGDIEEYCTNRKYTQLNSFWIKGNREKSYAYIRDDLITTVRIAMMTVDYARIVVAHSTINPKSKRNIEKELTLKGKVSFSGKRIIPIQKDYSTLSENELKLMNEWKNVQLLVKLNQVQSKMNAAIYGLYECGINEDEHNYRSVFVTDKQRKLLIEVSQRSIEGRIEIAGLFQMFGDYQVILKSIERLE